MKWTPELIRSYWPRVATIRPPHKDKIKIIDHMHSEMIHVTTTQNKGYLLKIRNANEITSIGFADPKSHKDSFWSIWQCFRCDQYIRQGASPFYTDNVCVDCLIALVKEAKQKARLNVTVERKSRTRQILM